MDIAESAAPPARQTRQAINEETRVRKRAFPLDNALTKERTNCAERSKTLTIFA